MRIADEFLKGFHLKAPDDSGPLSTKFELVWPSHSIKNTFKPSNARYATVMPRCSPEAHDLVVGDAIRHGIGGHISTRPTREGPFRSTDTITMASISKETAGQVDAEIQSVPLDVSAGWMKEATTSSRGTPDAVENPTLRVDPSCPVYNLESLGDMIYEQFRRRYGLLSTAEERLAAFIGSVVEHARSSAVLRLFARIIGVPAENLGGNHYKVE